MVRGERWSRVHHHRRRLLAAWAGPNMEMFDVAAAVPLFERARRLFEKIKGAESADVAYALSNLAQCHDFLGHAADARPLDVQAEAILTKRGDFAGLVTVLSNRADQRLIASEFDEAEQLARRALDLAEQHLGPDHETTATAARSLGGIYVTLGNDVRGEELFQRACAILTKIRGAEHPALIIPLNQLVIFYAGRRDFKHARSVAEQSLTIADKKLGAGNPLTAVCLSNLGLVLCRGFRAANRMRLLSRSNVHCE